MDEGQDRQKTRYEKQRIGKKMAHGVDESSDGKRSQNHGAHQNRCCKRTYCELIRKHTGFSANRNHANGIQTPQQETHPKNHNGGTHAKHHRLRRSESSAQ